MNPKIYNDAVSQLAIPKLTAFLKLMEDHVEIEGWAKMRAPEKRENMIDALTQSKELRKEFVVYYADDTGNEADFSEWEVATAALTESEDAPVSETGGDTLEPDDVTAPDPKPESAPKDAAPTPALIQTAPTAFVEGAFEQIVSDVAGLDAQASKISLTEAEDRMEFEHIRIGALLSHIQNSQHYLTLGYDNLREFLASETAMDYRKGTYLISNYNKVRDLGIPADALKGVTWSALRHIVPILDIKNYKKWLEAARSSTHVKLIEQVGKEKAKQAGALAPPTTEGATAEPKPLTKAFNVYPDQDETIKAALEKAKGQANVESNGAALEIIAAAYTGAPPSNTTVGAVMPDISAEGLTKIFTKMRADTGYSAAELVLTIFGEIWPDIDITAAFPTADAEAAE